MSNSPPAKEPKSISRLGHAHVKRFKKSVEDLAFIGAQPLEHHKEIRQSYFAAYGSLVRYIADLEQDIPKAKKGASKNV